MDLAWSAKDLEFRDEVRAFLDEKLTAELRQAGALMTSVYAEHEASMTWQAILHERGWAAPAWPPQYGGCDWTLTQHYIFSRECALAGAPALSPMGISMVAHAIIAFGTPEQKDYFLPRILTGEVFFCQGYSEPEAGSDLASLSMAAVVDDSAGDFICTGSKIWTTHAVEANWIFALVRTTRAERKQQGITFLLIDMTSPGIEIRPLVMTSGEEIQTQIFFDGVRVPKSNVIGAIDDGWTVAKYLLEFERGGGAMAPGLQVMAESIALEAGGRSGPDGGVLLDDPAFAAKLADVRIRTEVLEILEYRVLAAVADGRNPGAASSMLKILSTELSQAITELAMEYAGPHGRVYQPHATRPGGPIADYQPPADGYVSGEPWQAVAPLRYFNDRAGSIYAGSNEIQRNILAKANPGALNTMHFNLSAEQELLRDGLGRFLAARYDLDVSRAAAKTGAGWQPDIWRAFADELGILGAALPESAGGIGGGPVEVMVIAEELGRALVIEPFVDSVVVAGGLLQRAGGEAAAVLEAVGDGSAIVALAAGEGSDHWESLSTNAARESDEWVLNGSKSVVMAAPIATHLLIAARITGGPAAQQGISLFLTDFDATNPPAGLTVHSYRTVDDRRAADLVFDEVRLPATALVDHDAWESLARARDEGAAAVSAEAVGAMRRVLADTVDYCRQRQQFGAPIGSFQVLQHRMVDMYLELEQAVSAVYLAVLNLEAEPPVRARAVSAAKATVGRAARFVGQSAVQLHGGMGMTEELAIGHYFKRLTACQYEFGSTDHHRTRYARLTRG